METFKRIVLLLLTICLPLVVLVLVTQVAIAQSGEPVDPQYEVFLPDGVCIPQDIVRVQTATLLPPPALPLYDWVRTRWQNDWYDFSRDISLLYPSDVVSSEVVFETAPPTITWEFRENPPRVAFTAPSSGTFDVFMEYTTTTGLRYSPNPTTTILLESIRLENTNLVSVGIGGFLSTGYFLFTSTLIFPPPYEFVWATAVPTNIITYTLDPASEPHWLRWNLEEVVSFMGTVMVRDTRLHSDLVIEDFYFEPPNPVAFSPVTVTAVISNHGDVMPDLPYFYTEWYARPPWYTGPPVNPDDHDYGWCGDPGDCADGRYEFIFDADLGTPDHPLPAFPDPVLALIPGQSVVLTRVYAFPAAGDYELWAQVDVDLQHSAPAYGPNLESDEGNNVAGPLSLTVIPTDWGIYLPLVMRNY